jgi:hypothetical protein
MVEGRGAEGAEVEVEVVEITLPHQGRDDMLVDLAALEAGGGGARAIALIAPEATVGVGAHGGEVELGVGVGARRLGEVGEEDVKMRRRQGKSDKGAKQFVEDE